MDPNEINEEGRENSEVDREAPLCRFCWSSDVTDQNPLFAACKCNGGIRYIHFFCLQEWLNTKRMVKVQRNITTYYYKSFECELCKTAYPLIFKAKGKRFFVIDCDAMN